MVKPGDYVIDNKKKVNGIVTATDSNKEMARLFRFDLNKNKEDLEPSLYIYQPFKDINVEEQTGGTGKLVVEKFAEHDNHFHIIDVELNGEMNGLYGYFKDGYLELQIKYPILGTMTNTIQYDVLYDIIVSIEFQNIIELLLLL